MCCHGRQRSSREVHSLLHSLLQVKQSLTVFHAPKQKEGIDLKGMEGELVGWVDQYKGKVLSSNLPARIKFKLDVGGKEKPFFAHLVSSPPPPPPPPRHEIGNVDVSGVFLTITQTTNMCGSAQKQLLQMCSYSVHN